MIAAAFLLSPVFGVLMAIASEVVIRGLLEAGALALLAPLIGGCLGWLLLPKLRRRLSHLAAPSQRLGWLLRPGNRAVRSRPEHAVELPASRSGASRSRW